MKIAYWDIETHDLAAPFGPLLCASVLSLPENKMYVFRQDDYLRKRNKRAKNMVDDRWLCIDLRDFLEQHHLTCGWYSKGFDMPHLRSRLALHGERLLRKQIHFDPIWGFKGWRGVSFGSAKMKKVAENLGIEQKPDVHADVWMAAKVGDRDAMDEVVERCNADVRITRVLAEYALENDLLSNIGRY